MIVKVCVLEDEISRQELIEKLEDNFNISSVDDSEVVVYDVEERQEYLVGVVNDEYDMVEQGNTLLLLGEDIDNSNVLSFVSSEFVCRSIYSKIIDW